MIAQLNDNHDIEFFFFDADFLDTKSFNDRDSLMFLKIKQRILLHPTWKTVTLSGNIHNMLLPYYNKAAMAMYLRDDKDLNISSKLLSLRHFYAFGTLWDNSGDDLHLYQTENYNSIYSRSVDYENYLLDLKTIKVRYNGIYFTRKVTASNLVRQK